MIGFRICTRAVLLLLLFGSVVRAETVTLTASDMGRYEQRTGELGHHDPGSTDYLAGRLLGGTSTPTENYRNFFVFDLSGVAGTVVGGTLTVNVLENAGTSETYELHNVATPISTLVVGGYGMGGVFTDLGDGTVYGNCDIPASEAGTFVDILLNSDFVSAANAAIGSTLALGGVLTTIDYFTDHYMFGNSAENDPPLSSSKLVLEVIPVPEPGAMALLLAGAIGMFAFTRRRQLRRPR